MRASKRTQAIRKLRGEADELWMIAVLQKHGFYCLVCGAKTGPPHHFFPKGNYGHLRYDIDNGIPLCVSCHHRLHNVGDPTIVPKIISKKGKSWYNKMKEKARDRSHGYRTIGWYRENIEALGQEIPKRNSEKVDLASGKEN